MPGLRKGRCRRSWRAARQQERRMAFLTYRNTEGGQKMKTIRKKAAVMMFLMVLTGILTGMIAFGFEKGEVFYYSFGSDGMFSFVRERQYQNTGESNDMKTIIIQKAPKEAAARYVALTETGQLISGFQKLSDVRKEYRVEIELGLVQLKRELDKVYQ